jgi:hypothetical protein
MQEHRNHVGAKLEGCPSFLQITNRLIPRRDSPLLANPLLPGHPVYLLGMLHDHKARKRLLLARPGRIALTQTDLRSPTSEPLERFIIEIAISCDMSHTFGQRINPDRKQKRERFQQLTQNPKVKIGKVFAADLRKSKIHPTVKKSPPGAN